MDGDICRNPGLSKKYVRVNILMGIKKPRHDYINYDFNGIIDSWLFYYCNWLQFHVLTKEAVHRGMSLMKYLPVHIVDALTVIHATFFLGNLSKYGIHRPNIGPFFEKSLTGRSPVIDVGTIKKIKQGEIQVLINTFFYLTTKSVNILRIVQIWLLIKIEIIKHAWWW